MQLMGAGSEASRRKDNATHVCSDVGRSKAGTRWLHCLRHCIRQRWGEAGVALDEKALWKPSSGHNVTLHTLDIIFA